MKIVPEFTALTAAGNDYDAVIWNGIAERPCDLLGRRAHFINMILKHIRNDGDVGMDDVMLIDALILGANGHTFAHERICTAVRSLVYDADLLRDGDAVGAADDLLLFIGIPIHHTGGGARSLADSTIARSPEHGGDQPRSGGFAADTVYIDSELKFFQILIVALFLDDACNKQQHQQSSAEDKQKNRFIHRAILPIPFLRTKKTMVPDAPESREIHRHGRNRPIIGAYYNKYVGL